MAHEISGAPDTTEAEEMYLLTVARAEEAGHEGPLPVAALAERLSVSPASANEMVHRLTGRGLTSYEPYRGVGLTDTGRTIAYSVLRVRRLWASFLAEHLDLAPEHADTIACRLEHVTPADVADRLDGFLGNPAVGPLGRPTDLHREDGPLHLVTAGTSVEITRIPDDPPVRSFLAHHGVIPGETVTVIASGDHGVLVAAAGSVQLGTALAASIRAAEIRT